MSRKHYIKIAQAIKDNTNTLKDYDFINKRSFIIDVCDMLYKDNNNFDRARFIDACE